MKTLFALLIPLFASPLAYADNPIHEMMCANAGGFYGKFAVRRDGLQVEIIAQQGYADKLSTDLGAAPGQEAYRIDLRLAQHQCSAGANGAFRCQGSFQAILERYNEPRVMMTVFNAEIVSRALNPGHEITLALQDPLTGRQGTATVTFDDCQIR